MKTKLLVLIAAFILFPAAIIAQPSRIVGKWYTIDEDGNRKSLVVISKKANGTYEGVIEKLLTGDPERLCENCTGTEKNKPIKGVTVIKNMREDGDRLTGGTILDPANGKIYNCSITFDKSTGDLKVRGSLDKRGLIGRNQTWKRAVN